jgi:hypothetical protein
MGFYLRKAIRLGPVRINLSRSGVGLSAGVTGARFGLDAAGHPYVHAGRDGLYYRRRWPAAPPRTESLGPRPPDTPPPAATHDRVSWGWIVAGVLGLGLLMVLLGHAGR